MLSFPPLCGAWTSPGEALPALANLQLRFSAVATRSPWPWKSGPEPGSFLPA